MIANNFTAFSFCHCALPSRLSQRARRKRGCIGGSEETGDVMFLDARTKDGKRRSARST